MAVFEQRRVILNRGAFPAYRRYIHETLWPSLAGAGARPICLLSGLIGAPNNETYLFTGFDDLAAWQRSQPLIAGSSPDDGGSEASYGVRQELIAEEQARLLVDSGVRPKASITPEDRRSVYGMRRFWIRRQIGPSLFDTLPKASGRGSRRRARASSVSSATRRSRSRWRRCSSPAITVQRIGRKRAVTVSQRPGSQPR
jgi:hypothetical protein